MPKAQLYGTLILHFGTITTGIEIGATICFFATITDAVGDCNSELERHTDTLLLAPADTRVGARLLQRLSEALDPLSTPATVSIAWEGFEAKLPTVDGALLRIPAVEERHSGSYACLASNPAGQRKYAVQLKVYSNRTLSFIATYFSPHFLWSF